jgi:hypothetical protein
MAFSLCDQGTRSQAEGDSRLAANKVRRDESRSTRHGPRGNPGGRLGVERAYVFGLGSIHCEILTGEPAYTGPSLQVIPPKALSGETVEALSRIDTCGADDELGGLARPCLSVEPEERPRHAGEVAAAMERARSGVGADPHAVLAFPGRGTWPIN